MRQRKSRKSTSAPTEPSLTTPAASSSSTNDAPTAAYSNPESNDADNAQERADEVDTPDAGAAAKLSYNTLQIDQTTSGQDLLSNSQGFVDQELAAAADLQIPEHLNDFDGDAAFDALWNVYRSGADNGLEYQDDYMMRGGSPPLDPCAESSLQPMSSLNTASPQELIHSNHESAATHKDSLSGEVGVDFNSVERLCISTNTSDWSSIFSNSTNHSSRIQSGTPSTTGSPGKSPTQSLDAADSTNRNTLHPKISDSPRSSSCQCVQTALRILEVLETDNSKFNNSAFDHILGLKKSAISQCSLMLGCQACSAASAFVVLLIVICEKILISFEAWSTRYQGRKPRASEVSSEGERTDRNKGKIRKFFLGVYEVDSEHEQCSLLRSLAMVQIRLLHRLLNRLQDFVASRNWATHQASLASFVLRLEEAAAGLIARESHKID